MGRDPEIDLAKANRGLLVAPAGYGKTETIARSVAHLAGSGRQLILTHTHAGVHSLKTRLNSLGVNPSAYRVETIAGLCLRYAASYRRLSGLENDKPRSTAEWNEVYAAMDSLLRRQVSQDVIHVSYTGLFVDEYQDCTLEQHAITMQLAELLPCRIVGDPLQGIFDFSGQQLVDFDRDLRPTFQELPELGTPFRWVKAGNVGLGEWLREVREKLIAGEPIDLAGAPVNQCIVASKTELQAAQTSACYRIPKDGSVVAILDVEKRCHYLARRMNGSMRSMEEIGCARLMDWAEAFDAGKGPLATAALIKDCFARQPAVLARAVAGWENNGSFQPRRSDPGSVLCRLLGEVGSDPPCASLRSILEHARGIKGTILFRRELFDEACRAARAIDSGKCASATEAAWAVRNTTRQIGRRSDPRSISRTYLVKGLEYDHAIVLDASALMKKNLYVALTRGSKSLTVVSHISQLRPRSARSQSNSNRGRPDTPQQLSLFSP